MAREFGADIAEIAKIAAVPMILDAICRTTGMGFAAIAQVTEDHWIACAVRDGSNLGITPGAELQVETTICRDVRQSETAIIIENLAEHGKYFGHPVAAQGIQSYISMPIVLAGGRFFGTLMAVDRAPAGLDTPEITGMFRLFAELIAFHLAALEPAAKAAREDEFIALLGHELRNPLATINVSAWMLERARLEGKPASMVGAIRNSVVRMAGLIDNMLDFAEGRLDGPLTIEIDDDEPLEPVLNAVVAECASYWPDRKLEAQIALTDPVRCDRGRIAHMFSNLLRNAFVYGAPDQPIEVRAATADGVFELSVCNGGDPIAAEIQARLFRPFARGSDPLGRHGLGLGLYIAAAIARAHGGRLEVASSIQQTCFTFRMNLA